MSYQLLEEEIQKRKPSIKLMLKALLKVFLLKLIQLKETTFYLPRNINEKRVYEFMLLLEDIIRKTNAELLCR